MMNKRVQLYTRFERFWHWSQAFFIIMLALTGFEIHGEFSIFGFHTAVDLHNGFAWALVVLTAFAIFWHFVTGEWKQYVPATGHIMSMIRFYLVDIFTGARHPVEKTRENKLNPLQKITYFSLKTLVIPFQVLTGFFYLYYNSWSEWGILWRLDTTALLHTAGAFVFMIFLVLHVYLTTTGETIFSNIKAMITGEEELHFQKKKENI